MRSTKIGVLSTASAVTLLLAAACGGGGSGNGSAAAATNAAGSPGGGSAQVDLCTVLTTAQVQQVLGVPVGPGQKAENPAVGCGWLDPDAGNNSSVALLYVDPVIYDGTKKVNGQNGVTLTAVSGLGDEAFLETYSPDTKPLLLVKKGSAIVSISADVRTNGSGDTDPAKDAAAEKQLAAIVAQKL